MPSTNPGALYSGLVNEEFNVPTPTAPVQVNPDGEELIGEVPIIDLNEAARQEIPFEALRDFADEDSAIENLLDDPHAEHLDSCIVRVGHWEERLAQEVSTTEIANESTQTDSDPNEDTQTEADQVDNLVTFDLGDNLHMSPGWSNSENSTTWCFVFRPGRRARN